VKPTGQRSAASKAHPGSPASRYSRDRPLLAWKPHIHGWSILCNAKAFGKCSNVTQRKTAGIPQISRNSRNANREIVKFVASFILFTESLAKKKRVFQHHGIAGVVSYRVAILSENCALSGSSVLIRQRDDADVDADCAISRSRPLSWWRPSAAGDFYSLVRGKPT